MPSKGAKMQQAPTTVRCGNENHEHLDEFDADGEPLECMVPMICHHCKRPAHYDSTVEDYAHDDDSSCFLMGPTRSTC